MANKTVGKINCPFCMSEAEVKENVKQKYYIWCSDDGIIQPTKPNFQEYIKENATFTAADKQEEIPETKIQTIPAAQPEKEAVETATNDNDEMGW